MADDDDVDPADEDAPPPAVGAAIEPASPSKPRFQPRAVNVGGESLADRLIPHLKMILLMAGVVAIVLLAVFGYRWWVERGETAKTDKVAAVLAAGRKPVRAPDSAGSGDGSAAGSAVDSAAGSGAAGSDSYPDDTTRANTILTAIAQQGVDPDGVYHATALADAGKLDEALTEYAKLENDGGIDGVLAREGKGLALEAKAAAEKDNAASQKGYEAAFNAFVSEQPDPNGPRYAYALYHQGRMQVQLGKQADARATFAKARAAAKDSEDLSELIEKRIASLGA